MTAERIYMRHLRALKFCARGSREFFQKHQLDWSKFLREGIERDRLAGTGDAMAIKAAEIADAENNNG